MTSYNDEYMEEMLEKVTLWKRELSKMEQLSLLFEEIDEGSLSMEEEVDLYDPEALDPELMGSYWSDYNRTKRLLRSLQQANRFIMEYIHPEVFQQVNKQLKETKIFNSERKCSKCGVYMEMCLNVKKLCIDCSQE